MGTVDYSFCERRKVRLDEITGLVVPDLPSPECWVIYTNSDRGNRVYFNEAEALANALPGEVIKRL